MTGAATDLWIVEAITATNRSSPRLIVLTAPNGAAPNGAALTQTIGSLEAGHYTATVSGYEEATNQSISENWSFTVLAPVYQVYLPLVKR